MRKTKTLAPVRARRWRFTRLDECGNPIFGDNGQVVSNGVITATMTIVTNDTDEIRTTNSNGDTCLLIPATSRIDGVSLEAQFCGMDPDIFEMATGMPVVYDIDGAAVGVVADTDVDPESFSFALDLWTGVAGDDTCGEVGEIDYGYMLLKYMKGGRLADFTVENGAINFSVTGASSRRGGAWGKGPYNVVENAGGVAGPLLVALTSSQPLLAILTKVAPPAAGSGGRPLLNPSWVNLSSIGVSGVDGDMELDFTVSPSIPNGQGVWYDFGDDTWEYVTAGGGAYTHEFDEAGTYTVTASANGKVVSRQVTVPFDAS